MGFIPVFNISSNRPAFYTLAVKTTKHFLYHQHKLVVLFEKFFVKQVPLQRLLPGFVTLGFVAPQNARLALYGFGCTTVYLFDVFNLSALLVQGFGKFSVQGNTIQ